MQPLVKRDILRVLSSNLLVAIMGFLNSFIFPKIMTIDDYAIYHTFTLYLNYIAFFHLGFPNGLMIKYAGKQYKDTIKSEYKAETYIILSVLSLFTAVFIVIFFLTQNKMILYICLAIIPIDYLGSIKALWQAWGEFSLFSKTNTILAVSIPLLALVYYFLFKKLPGNIYIIIYLIINWIVLAFVLRKELSFVRKAKPSCLISKKNLAIEKTGFGFLLGNYINTLFTSVDKQFVKCFFSNAEFAYYSFGMSLQALMAIFITSLAQPLFPMLAKKEMNYEKYSTLKNLLLIFGSFSGCAYFFGSFAVKMFIGKYILSLNVIRIYFLVFPALSVVNCLYINLYKLENRMKEYLATLIGIFAIAVLLNCMFVNNYGSFEGVAIATTITYYIWLIIGIARFQCISFTKKDYGFIIVFIILFNSFTRINNDILGFFLYFVTFILIAFVFYKKDMIWLVDSYFYKLKKRG